MTGLDDVELAQVKLLGRKIGYGNLMSLAELGWREELKDRGLPGGEFTVGPCAAMMVDCAHSVKDDNNHCEICCGSGRVTKYVAENITRAQPLPADRAAALDAVRSVFSSYAHHTIPEGEVRRDALQCLFDHRTAIEAALMQGSSHHD